ncbi:MAG TPA: crosslink repair DNA glycosylase YcaQ family protein [Bdellovibrionota bacterium]|nr:crosslink repair DNA glycosylase YcaQ family protein [Bdellovibrionota bacterium]
MIDLTLPEARLLALNGQALLEPEPFGKGKGAALRTIEHLGYVQIDTISVVERAHHHVLWTRVPDYSPALLHELQARDRTVFEYWSHAAAYLPMRDYRFSLHRKRQFAEGKRHWFRRNRKLQAYVLDRIRAEGPLQARDFENPRKRGTWWDWKPAKVALEQLFQEGTLMIRERKGFQKVYDLTERVLPEGVDTREPTPVEHCTYLIESTLRSHGLASEREMRYLRRGLDRPMREALAELEESGKVRKLRVVEKETYYCLAETLELPRSRPGDEVRILSPFDSFIIQRKRLQRFFEFDYQIECYVPEPKRKFGYFCLPLLWKDRLVGRIDAKADRTERTLSVKSLHLELKPSERAAFKAPFLTELARFAAFNGCEKIAPGHWSRRLR